jgi:hypothetical protein
MTRQEVVDKSTDLIAPILGQDRTVALIDAVLDIDRLGDVQELRPLLQA